MSQYEMKLSPLSTDEGAVSPVIGVILMVAVTVILSAVIATFVLSFGGTQQESPTVTFDYSVDSSGSTDELVVKHISGDKFRAGRVEFSGEGIASSDLGETWADLTTDVAEGSDVTAGQRTRLEITDPDLEFKLEVIWTSDDDRESYTISEASGPVPTNPSP